MPFTLEDAEKMYTKAMEDADKGDNSAFLFLKYCDPFDFVDEVDTKVDYAKVHREETAQRKEKEKKKKKTRVRNRQRMAKLNREARQKKLTDLQKKSAQRLEEKKAKRAEKVSLETCPARKELRQLKHARVRSFSVD